MIDARPPSLSIDRQPDLKGRLGRQAVKAKGREEADHAMGDALAGLDEAVLLRDLNADEPVEPPPSALEKTPLFEAPQIGSGDAVGIEIPRPKHAGPPCQLEDLVRLRRHGTKRRLLPLMTDVS